MIETEPHLEGKIGRTWLIPEPHPGHFLVHRVDAVNGLTWFLVSVDIDPHRVVLRALAREPEADEDLVLLEDPLIEVEVPAGVDGDDFGQLPGLVAQAIVGDLLVPSRHMVPQWKGAVARLLATLRRRRMGQARQDKRDANMAKVRLAKDKRDRRRKNKRRRR